VPKYGCTELNWSSFAPFNSTLNWAVFFGGASQFQFCLFTTGRQDEINKSHDAMHRAEFGPVGNYNLGVIAAKRMLCLNSITRGQLMIRVALTPEILTRYTPTMA